ncbi:phage portal protein, partial [Enterococcus hulanensis]|uniref:phage portal protein n=1 Tax=Enterococcus hulanensis TaxID=2559929 RepID=UPI002891EFDF
NKERMVKKAIMRRLRLLTHSWSIKDDLNKPQGLIENVKAFFVSDDKKQEDLYNKVNDIQILFTPNVPQSDEEIMNVIKGMLGIVSEETLCEMAERLTGVSAEEELKRVNKEKPNVPVLDYEFSDSDDSKEQTNVDKTSEE